MFVRDIKALQKRKKAVRFSTVEISFEWNQNTETFEQVEKDVQAAIDNFKGLDLKSMIDRNIKPLLDGSPTYGDVTHLKDVNLGKMFDLGHLDITLDAAAEVPAAADNKNPETPPVDEPISDGKDAK